MKTHIIYKHIFGNVQEQKELARLYRDLLEVREELIQEQDDQEKAAGEVEDTDNLDDDDDNICLPGAENNIGPCTEIYIYIERYSNNA